MNIKGHGDRTPLHCSCEKGYLPIVEYLISKGANIEATDENGDYGIHYASKYAYLPIVQYLIEKQNVNIRIPLHFACKNRRIQIDLFKIK